MIVMGLAFNVPGISTDTLFGRYGEYKMRSIRLGFCWINILSDKTSGMFTDALRGLAQDENWMIENHEAMRKFKADFSIKTREEVEKFHRETVEHYKNAFYASEEENVSLKRENRELRQAVETIRKFGIKETEEE